MDNKVEYTLDKSATSNAAANSPVAMNQQVEDWKKQYGDVILIKNEPEDDEAQLVFYFKKPQRQHFSRFIKESMKDAYKAMRTMVDDLALYPAPEVRNKLFEEKPGLVVAVGNELNKVIGVSQDFLTSKV